MRTLKVPHMKLLIACLAPAFVLMLAGCDTTAHSGAFAVFETSLSFIGDFLRNALAAFLF